MSEAIMAGRSSDPTDNLKKRPSKGILKTSSSFEVEDGPSMSRKEKGKGQKGTKWDEMNIIETLHPAGKDYGHMKIEEPKTPYERPLSEDQVDGVDPAALAHQIAQNATKPLKSLRRVEENDSDEELTPEERERKKAFESKRKAHYNEFLAAKKAMTELEDEEDEEEEEGAQNPSSPKSKED